MKPIKFTFEALGIKRKVSAVYRKTFLYTYRWWVYVTWWEPVTFRIFGIGFKFKVYKEHELTFSETFSSKELLKQKIIMRFSEMLTTSVQNTEITNSQLNLK